MARRRKTWMDGRTVFDIWPWTVTLTLEWGSWNRYATLRLVMVHVCLKYRLIILSGSNVMARKSKKWTDGQTDRHTDGQSTPYHNTSRRWLAYKNWHCPKNICQIFIKKEDFTWLIALKTLTGISKTIFKALYTNASTILADTCQPSCIYRENLIFIGESPWLLVLGISSVERPWVERPWSMTNEVTNPWWRKRKRDTVLINDFAATYNTHHGCNHKETNVNAGYCCSMVTTSGQIYLVCQLQIMHGTNLIRYIITQKYVCFLLPYPT
jgi:hypothetical protein